MKLTTAIPLLCVYVLVVAVNGLPVPGDLHHEERDLQRRFAFLLALLPEALVGLAGGSATLAAGAGAAEIGVGGLAAAEVGVGGLAAAEVGVGGLAAAEVGMGGLAAAEIGAGGLAAAESIGAAGTALEAGGGLAFGATEVGGALEAGGALAEAGTAVEAAGTAAEGLEVAGASESFGSKVLHFGISQGKQLAIQEAVEKAMHALTGKTPPSAAAASLGTSSALGETSYAAAAATQPQHSGGLLSSLLHMFVGS